MSHPAIQAIVDAADALNNNAKALQDAVDESKKMPLAEQARFFFHLKSAYDALDTARKAIYKQADFINKSLLPEAFDREDMDKIRIPDIARSVYLVPKLSVSIIDDPEEGKEKGYQWLRDQGASELITLTVNTSTLAAYMGNRMKEEGLDPPADIFKVNPYMTIGMSKYTPKD